LFGRCHVPEYVRVLFKVKLILPQIITEFTSRRSSKKSKSGLLVFSTSFASITARFLIQYVSARGFLNNMQGSNSAMSNSTMVCGQVRCLSGHTCLEDVCLCEKSHLPPNPDGTCEHYKGKKKLSYILFIDLYLGFIFNRLRFTYTYRYTFSLSIIFHA
jgi:hypothetical protein